MPGRWSRYTFPVNSRWLHHPNLTDEESVVLAAQTTMSPLSSCLAYITYINCSIKSLVSYQAIQMQGGLFTILGRTATEKPSCST